MDNNFFGELEDYLDNYPPSNFLCKDGASPSTTTATSATTSSSTTTTNNPTNNKINNMSSAKAALGERLKRNNNNNNLGSLGGIGEKRKLELDSDGPGSMDPFDINQAKNVKLDPMDDNKDGLATMEQQPRTPGKLLAQALLEKRPSPNSNNSTLDPVSGNMIKSAEGSPERNMSYFQRAMEATLTHDEDMQALRRFYEIARSPSLMQDQKNEKVGHLIRENPNVARLVLKLRNDKKKAKDAAAAAKALASSGDQRSNVFDPQQQQQSLQPNMKNNAVSMDANKDVLDQQQQQQQILQQQQQQQMMHQQQQGMSPMSSEFHCNIMTGPGGFMDQQQNAMQPMRSPIISSPRGMPPGAGPVPPGAGPHIRGSMMMNQRSYQPMTSPITPGPDMPGNMWDAPGQQPHLQGNKMINGQPAYQMRPGMVRANMRPQIGYGAGGQEFMGMNRGGGGYMVNCGPHMGPNGYMGSGGGPRGNFGIGSPARMANYRGMGGGVPSDRYMFSGGSMEGSGMRFQQDPAFGFEGGMMNSGPPNQMVTNGMNEYGNGPNMSQRMMGGEPGGGGGGMVNVNNANSRLGFNGSSGGMINSPGGSVSSPIGPHRSPVAGPPNTVAMSASSPIARHTNSNFNTTDRTQQQQQSGNFPGHLNEFNNQFMGTGGGAPGSDFQQQQQQRFPGHQQQQRFGGGIGPCGPNDFQFNNARTNGNGIMRQQHQQQQQQLHNQQQQLHQNCSPNFNDDFVSNGIGTSIVNENEILNENIPINDFNCQNAGQYSPGSSWKNYCGELRKNLLQNLQKALTSQGNPNAFAIAEKVELEAFNSSDSQDAYTMRLAEWLAGVFHQQQDPQFPDSSTNHWNDSSSDPALSFTTNSVEQIDSLNVAPLDPSDSLTPTLLTSSSSLSAATTATVVTTSSTTNPSAANNPILSSLLPASTPPGGQSKSSVINNSPSIGSPSAKAATGGLTTGAAATATPSATTTANTNGPTLFSSVTSPLSSSSPSTSSTTSSSSSSSSSSSPPGSESTTTTFTTANTSSTTPALDDNFQSPMSFQSPENMKSSGGGGGGGSSGSTGNRAAPGGGNRRPNAGTNVTGTNGVKNPGQVVNNPHSVDSGIGSPRSIPPPSSSLYSPKIQTGTSPSLLPTSESSPDK